jgi:plastocyanin
MRLTPLEGFFVITVLVSMLLVAAVTPNANASAQTTQTPTTRNIIIEWTKDLAGQDRFYPDFIIVNQGDTVALTFINNDTVVHDLVIGPPYNIVVNASVPGLRDDVTGQLITTPATRNSPGVLVSGTPGNVSATYSFVAKYPGIFEYVCTYHIQVGMIGYMVVLAPNTSSITQTNRPNQTVPQSSTMIQVSVEAGSGTNVNLPGYTPADITVVIGVNSTVKWTNNDNMPHTVTASDGSFDSGNLKPDATYVYTFTKAGVYHYNCTYHSWMHGTVTVLTETISLESGEHGEFTVVLTAYEVYGIIGFAIVALLAIMMVVGRTRRNGEQAPVT